MFLQDELFTRNGLVSTRLFPPVIPIVDIPRSAGGAEADIKTVRFLERIRKSHPLELRGVRPGGARRLSVPVLMEGFTQLCEAIRQEYPDARTFEDAPRIVLAWDREEDVAASMPVIPSVPVTRALWLWAVECFPGPDREKWWESAQWEELFCRRITVREK